MFKLTFRSKRLNTISTFKWWHPYL